MQQIDEFNLISGYINNVRKKCVYFEYLVTLTKYKSCFQFRFFVITL